MAKFEITINISKKGLHFEKVSQATKRAVNDLTTSLGIIISQCPPVQIKKINGHPSRA